MVAKTRKRRVGSSKARAIRAATPRAEGYSAAYRMNLEQEFLGEDGKAAMHRAPTVLRAAISEMLKEIENLRARVGGSGA